MQRGSLDSNVFLELLVLFFKRLGLLSQHKQPNTLRNFRTLDGEKVE